jgi:hypothetical protein
MEEEGRSRLDGREAHTVKGKEQEGQSSILRDKNTEKSRDTQPPPLGQYLSLPGAKVSFQLEETLL